MRMPWRQSRAARHPPANAANPARAADYMSAAHPFLFFDETELNALRKRLKRPPLNARWRLLLKNANRCLTRPRYSFSHVRQSLGVCGLTAFAYVVTRKKAYGERALKE